MNKRCAACEVPFSRWWHSLLPFLRHKDRFSIGVYCVDCAPLCLVPILTRQLEIVETAITVTVFIQKSLAVQVISEESRS